jgi:hypothetical protein
MIEMKLAGEVSYPTFERTQLYESQDHYEDAKRFGRIFTKDCSRDKWLVKIG